MRTGGEADAFAVVWMLAWYNILGWLGAVAVHAPASALVRPRLDLRVRGPSLQRLVDRALDDLDKFDAERSGEAGRGGARRGRVADARLAAPAVREAQEEAAVATSLLNQWRRQRCRSGSGDLEVAELLGAEGLAAEIDGLDGMAPWRPAFTSPGATAMHGGALTSRPQR